MRTAPLVLCLSLACSSATAAIQGTRAEEKPAPPKDGEKEKKEDVQGTADGKGPENSHPARTVAVAARALLASPAPFEAKGPEARAPCAETLGRFLLAIGRPQRFDVPCENGVPREPRAPLQDYILRGYGLAQTKPAK